MRDAFKGKTPATRRPKGGVTALNRQYAGDVEARLKAVACHLFATNGVDGVTIRQILEAAKVKNFGAIGYYFGSKENLVRQILIDGSREIDIRRGELLGIAERPGHLPTAEDIVNILVHAVIDLDDVGARKFICFNLMVSMTHRDLYVTTMFEQPNTHFNRCVAHLYRLMPGMPIAAARQRIMFMKSNMTSALARREAALASGTAATNEWAHDHVLRHFVQSETAMLLGAFAPGPDWPADDAQSSRDIGLVPHDPL